MTQSTSLVCVVNGAAYEKFAEDLGRSCSGRFVPTSWTYFHVLKGPPGWPDASMYRWHVLLENLPRSNFIFLIDADMLVTNCVGPEILPPNSLGLTATLHPGYVGKPRAELPYERRPESAAYIAPLEGHSAYYAGGFVGGERLAVRMLATKIANIVDRDVANGIIPVHHDESALNRVLALAGPDLSLDPGFCCPENDEWYRSWWPEQWPRKITALDKSAEIRALRETG